MRVRSLGQEDPLEEEIATHSSILAWETPWTEEPCGLRPRGHKESHTTKCVFKENREGTDEGRGTKDGMVGSWNMVTADRESSKQSRDVFFKVWVGQKVCSGFPIRWYRKSE